MSGQREMTGRRDVKRRRQGGKEAAGKLITSALTTYYSSHGLSAAGWRVGLAQEQNGEMCRSPCAHTGNPK